MSEKIYAQGLFGYDPRQDAPDYVVGNVSVKVSDFIAWLESQEPNGQGFIKLNVTRQKANAERWSFSLDTWQPKQESEIDSDSPF